MTDQPQPPEQDPFAAPSPGSAVPPTAGDGQPAPGYGQPAPGYGAAQPAFAAPAYGSTVPALPYAPWILRVGGFVIDYAAIAIPSWILFVLGAALGGALGALVEVLALAVAIGVWVWNIGLRQGATGQSIGKGLTGMRVYREADGAMLGTWLSLGRSLLHFVDQVLCYLGYLWPLWDAKRQTFSDKIVSTIVLEGQPKSSLF